MTCQHPNYIVVEMAEPWPNGDPKNDLCKCVDCRHIGPRVPDFVDE